VRIIAVPRTLGGSWFPYELFMAVTVIVCLLEVGALVAIYFSYRALSRGSKYSGNLKNTVRVIGAIFGLLGLAFVYSNSAFWACDYSEQKYVDGASTFTLRRFPEIPCW